MTPWITLIVWIFPNLGQWGRTAHMEGAGNAAALLASGAEALYGNPAQLLSGTGLSWIQGYRMPYALPEFYQVYSGISWATVRHGIGVGIWTQGLPSLYRETHLLVDLAHRFQSWVLAFRPRLFWLQVSDPNVATVSATAWLVDWGVTWTSGAFQIGFHQENAAHGQLRVIEVTEDLPSTWEIAVRYERPIGVSWMAAIGPGGKGRIGVESWFTSGFAVRLGVDERNLTIGMGLRSGRWEWDFSGENHRDLGTTYGVALQYRPARFP